MNNRREEARKMRTQGYSIKHIAKVLSCAQSNVSIWARDIKLTQAQSEKLHNNMHSKESIEKRRAARLISEEKKRQIIRDAAYADIGDLSEREILLLAAGLYWAEGGKNHSSFKFSNGDPRMIQVIILFLTKICKVDTARLRIHIHIHESLSTANAEEYWQQITRLPRNQFYKTYNKPNKSSKGLKTTLPYGVCDIYVQKSSVLLWKTQGWTEAIYKSVCK